MSKQRVFKPNYLLRGKQHNKTSNTLFQLQKYDCHMLVPSPFCLLTSWSSCFFSVLSFLIRWERRKYSRFYHVIGWGRHRSFRDIFGGGAFQVHFHFTAPNVLELSHVRQGVWGHTFQNDHAFTHTGLNVLYSRLFQSTRICRKSQDQHFFLLVVHFGRIDTGSIHCICIGCILSTLSFAEQCILFKTSVINENVSHT